MSQVVRTVLLVGSQGHLGKLIARELLQLPDVRLRVLNRRETPAAPDVEVHQGNATDPAIADAATKGVDVVISALGGGPEALVDGQLSILAAAERNGVKRFIPSDYSGNFFGMNLGDHIFLDMHLRVAEKVRASSVGYSFIISGGFMEVVLAPFMQTFDFANAKATVWSTGNETLDLTSMGDVAKLVTRVAFDERAHNQVVEYAGEVTSIRKIAADFEAITGRPMEVVSRGDVDALRRLIEQKKETATNPREYAFLQYQLIQLQGKTKLKPIWNEKYPDLHPKSMRDVLRGLLDNAEGSKPYA